MTVQRLDITLTNNQNKKIFTILQLRFNLDCFYPFVKKDLQENIVIEFKKREKNKL